MFGRKKDGICFGLKLKLVVPFMVNGRRNPSD